LIEGEDFNEDNSPDVRKKNAVNVGLKTRWSQWCNAHPSAQ